MKALLRKASNWSYNKNIEVNSLEELLKIDDNLIIEHDNYTLDLYKRTSDLDGYDNDFEIIITIYDDYVE